LLGLRTLNLKLTAISDAGLEHLQALKNLQQVDVRLTRVTEGGVRTVAAGTAKAQIDY